MKRAIRVGNQELRLRPGARATAPKGTVHHFFNPGEERITFQVELFPGHLGFEQTLIVGYGLANDGLTDQNSIPKHPLYTAVLLTSSDMSFPGLTGWAMHPMRPLAAYARSRGIERALLRKYGA